MEICSLDSLSFFLGVLQSSSLTLVIDVFSNSAASTSLSDLLVRLERFGYEETSRCKSVVVDSQRACLPVIPAIMHSSEHRGTISTSLN